MKTRSATKIGRAAGRAPRIVSALQACNGVLERPRIALIEPGV
jgi:hypothetical protein